MGPRRAEADSPPETAAKLLSRIDGDQRHVLPRPAVAQRQELFRHHGHFHAIGWAERIQHKRVPAYGQFLVLRGTGDRPVDAGELAAVFFVPLPDGGGVQGAEGMLGLQEDLRRTLAVWPVFE